MSISSIQKKRVYATIAKYLYSSGERPRNMDINRKLADYFSKHPIGEPFRIERNIFAQGRKSRPEEMNNIMASAIANADTLYEVAREQSNQSMEIATIMRSQLDRLRNKRRALISQIDEYLFTMYNTDGYYYSFSDTFNDLSNTDLNLTSAFIDVVNGSVTLPTISSLSNVMKNEYVSLASISFTAGKDSGGVGNSIGTVPVQATHLSPFRSALDGLNNTIWASEVVLDVPVDEVVCVVNLSISKVGASISRIDLDPYGIKPVEVFIRASTDGSTYEPWGQGIQTNEFKMSFFDQPKDIVSLQIYLRKTEPDYTVNDLGTLRYSYMFGAKDIFLIEQVFDSEATFVTTPIALGEELQAENVIDSVAIVVDQRVPAGTDVTYWVAAEVEDTNPTLDSFDWRKIVPLNPDQPAAESVIKFEGSTDQLKTIKPKPSTGSLGPSELELILPDETNSDYSKRNPFTLEGVDLWRIAEFVDNPIPGSVKLEEGINTTRIYHVAYNPSAIDLSFWTDYFSGDQYSHIAYQDINSGTGFFWGGVVGESYRSVYIETYLESLDDQNVYLKRFVKEDSNAHKWNIKVFLNGTELGHLPIGTDDMIIPWKFQKGLNHIAITLLIPDKQMALSEHPDEGTVDLMEGSSLFDFGTVKLATWTNVDLFTLLKNTTGDPETFTIYNDTRVSQLVSRRKPTTNFRVKYTKANQTSPTSVRLRVDLKRQDENQHVSPIIDKYRMRFLYGNGQ